MMTREELEAKLRERALRHTTGAGGWSLYNDQDATLDRQAADYLDAPIPTAAEALALVWGLDEDDIEQAITDSLDLDWTPRDAAKAVMRLLNTGANPSIAAEKQRYDGLFTTWAESRERHLKAEKRAEQAEALVATLRASLKDGLAHLTAANSLIERADEDDVTPAMAVASDRMFLQMLDDYRASEARMRAAFASTDAKDGGA